MSRINNYTKIASLIGLLWFAVHASFDDDVRTWSHSIAETFHLINTRSYHPISLEHALPKALNTLINSQDTYCRFLGPQEYRDLVSSTQGEFFGIGVTVGRKKDAHFYLTIFDIMHNSPAAKKGLRVDDKITAINGKPITTLSTHEAVEQLKGYEKYSPVTLTIERNKKNMTVTVERDVIKEDHVHCYYLPASSILYCRVSLFTQQALTDLEQAIKKALPRQIKGLILDVRNNPGGVLQAAVRCAGLFLPEKSLVTVTKDRSGKIVEEFYTTQKPAAHFTCPIIILVNSLTASAAELFAGALKIHSEQQAPKALGHIFLLGTQTVGKGSVQEVIPVAQKCALCLTTYMYYLPDQSSINKIGICPHFMIESKVALVKKPTQHKRSPEEYLQHDHQVQCATQLIALLDLARQFYPSAIDAHSKAHSWLKKHFGMDKLTVDKL